MLLSLLKSEKTKKQFLEKAFLPYSLFIAVQVFMFHTSRFQTKEYHQSMLSPFKEETKRKNDNSDIYSYARPCITYASSVCIVFFNTYFHILIIHERKSAECQLGLLNITIALFIIRCGTKENSQPQINLHVPNISAQHENTNLYFLPKHCW